MGATGRSREIREEQAAVTRVSDGGGGGWDQDVNDGGGEKGQVLGLF